MLSMKPHDLGKALSIYRMRHTRLLSRIHRRFHTVTDTHAVGPLRLGFTRITDPDVVLNRMVAEQDRLEKVTGKRLTGDELHLPYWAQIWDSAIGMAGYIATEPSLKLEGEFDQTGSAPLKQRKTVLDLGCGMGFSGMAAAAMGAQVMFADLEADCLLFARLNSLRWADRVRTRQLNWQKDVLKETFDVILGADVLYERKQWVYLEPFFQQHLAPDGTILLGEPGRHTGDDFPGWVGEFGWKIRHLEQRIPRREKPIRIFELKRVAEV